MRLIELPIAVEEFSFISVDPLLESSGLCEYERRDLAENPAALRRCFRPDDSLAVDALLPDPASTGRRGLGRQSCREICRLLGEPSGERVVGGCCENADDRRDDAGGGDDLPDRKPGGSADHQFQAPGETDESADRAEENGERQSLAGNSGCALQGDLHHVEDADIVLIAQAPCDLDEVNDIDQRKDDEERDDDRKQRAARNIGRKEREHGAAEHHSSGRSRPLRTRQ